MRVEPTACGFFSSKLLLNVIPPWTESYDLFDFELLRVQYWTEAVWTWLREMFLSRVTFFSPNAVAATPSRLCLHNNPALRMLGCSVSDADRYCRKNLSISLNFRPNRNDSASKVSNVKFYSHHLLVLLGLRPSISSVLRGYFLTSPQNHNKSHLASVTESLPSTSSTASYVIASDGATTTVFEKDRITAKTMCSSSFIVATNHDSSLEGPLGTSERQKSTEARPSHHQTVTGIEDLIAESIDRKGCVTARWQRAVARYRKRHPGASEDEVRVSQSEVVKWLEEYPVTNECTHFATVMDPKVGEIVWVRRYEDPAYTDEEEAWHG